MNSQTQATSLKLAVPIPRGDQPGRLRLATKTAAVRSTTEERAAGAQRRGACPVLLVGSCSGVTNSHARRGKIHCPVAPIGGG